MVPNPEPSTFEEDLAGIGPFLMHAYEISFVEFHSRPAAFTTDLSGKPRISELARHFLNQGLKTVPTLTQKTLQFDDDLTEGLALLCDGTRTIEEVKLELKRRIENGESQLRINGEQPLSASEAVKVFDTRIDETIQYLTTAGLFAR